MIRTFFVGFLLLVGLSELQFRQAKAQVIWKPIDTPKPQTSPVIWETNVSDAEKADEPLEKWEIVPKSMEQSQYPSIMVWEVLETEDEEFIKPLENESNSKFIRPNNLEEAESLLNIIPLQSSDFKHQYFMLFPLHQY